jgi:hypothetical protein
MAMEYVLWWGCFFYSLLGLSSFFSFLSITWLETFFSPSLLCILVFVTSFLVLLNHRGSFTFGTFGPPHPWIGRLVRPLVTIIFRFLWWKAGVREFESSYSKNKLKTLKERLIKRETVYLLGITAGSHNAGTN